MNNLSNERLRAIADLGSPDCMALPPSHDQCAAMACELLAYREAQDKAVLWEISNPGEGSYYTPHKPEPGDYRHELIIAEFYASPQLPAVPPELTRDKLTDVFMEDDNFRDTFRHGYETCRAVVLAGAPKPEVK